jgi:trimeric autotransporter adhesin
MKKIVLVVILGVLSTLQTFAQSTEITPGSILPKLTTAQRTSMASPVNGMLVFDTNTQSYWFRQSGAWVELPKGGSTNNYWELNGLAGNEIKNTNSGGFWSANPVGLIGGSSNTTNPPVAPVNGSGTRLMWIPSRSAFRVGTVIGDVKSWDADSIGLFSFASGINTKAKGYSSTAMGYFSTASGSYSTAMGIGSVASGYASTAMGSFTTASGFYSTALGIETYASGPYSTAMGHNTQASGSRSTSVGHNTTASGSTSTAMGHNTTASASHSTAMGSTTSASGPYAVSMGFLSSASGQNSTSLGYANSATGDLSTAMGQETTASGIASTTMGQETVAAGEASTAMGQSSIASGIATVAVGWNSQATGDYSYSIGNASVASGTYSIALGTRVSTNGHRGSFVMGDYITPAQGTSGDTLKADAQNRFLARFSNGYKFYTNNDLSSSSIGIIALANANSWSSISDSTKKERFIAYNPENILKSVAAMRVGTWNYKGDTRPNGRHWGVMAQDFYQHFGHDAYGTIGCDTMIATADFDGVAFAAIKALELRTRQLQAENEALKEQVKIQNAKIEDLVNLRDEISSLKAMLMNPKQ